MRTQGTSGGAGDPLGDPTVALRHKVVVYTHHPLRRRELLTHTWHRASSAEHKDGTCLGVCHARVSRTEACPNLPQNHAVFVVELRGHVSNSCQLAITFCWWLWQREARSFPLIHEQNQKAPCKGGQIIGFAIEYHCPAWSPRGEAQPPISFKRDEDRT